MNTLRFILGKGRNLYKRGGHSYRKQWSERMVGKKISPVQIAVGFSAGIFCMANYVYYSLGSFDRWTEAIDIYCHPSKMRKLMILNSYNERNLKFGDIPRNI